MKDIIEEIRRKNSKTVYTCSSIYNVLLALCIVLILEDYKNSYIVMFSPEKKLLEAFNALSEKISALGINNVVINKHTRLHRLIGWSDISNKYRYRCVMRELEIEKNNFLLVNFCWSQKRVTYPASMYLDRCKEAIFVEEGNSGGKRLVSDVEETIWKSDRILEYEQNKIHLCAAARKVSCLFKMEAFEIRTAKLFWKYIKRYKGQAFRGFSERER